MPIVPRKIPSLEAFASGDSIECAGTFLRQQSHDRTKIGLVDCPSIADGKRLTKNGSFNGSPDIDAAIED